MSLEHKLGHASGPSMTKCWFLGYRYDGSVGFRWDAMESRAIKSEPDVVRSRLRQGGLMTGLWRAPSGTAWVSHLGGDVHVLGPDRRPDDSPGIRHSLPSALAGIWGCDEELVFTWGEHGTEARMFVWDGSAWRRADPPGMVHAVHGASRDSIYCVGAEGLIARWTGGGWRRMGSPVVSPFSAIHVIDDDEIYIVGAGGRVLEGSVHGWSEVLHSEMALGDVTKFQGRVFVAAGPHGLLTLEQDRLEPFRDDIPADRFDSRGALIISTPHAIYETDDTQRFRARDVDALIGVIGADRPIWYDHPF